MVSYVTTCFYKSDKNEDLERRNPERNTWHIFLSNFIVQLATSLQMAAAAMLNMSRYINYNPIQARYITTPLMYLI